MMKTGADARITWAVAEMHRGMAEPMRMQALAAGVNLSSSRFRQLFLAQTGATPQAYLQRLGLRRARLLIERTFLSVKEVMGLVGYNDPSHFSRDFRRWHGVPPSALRGGGAATPMPSSSSRSASMGAEPYPDDTAQLLKAPTHTRIRQKRGRDPSARCA